MHTHTIRHCPVYSGICPKNMTMTLPQGNVTEMWTHGHAGSACHSYLSVLPFMSNSLSPMRIPRGPRRNHPPPSLPHHCHSTTTSTLRRPSLFLHDLLLFLLHPRHRKILPLPTCALQSLSLPFQLRSPRAPSHRRRRASVRLLRSHPIPWPRRSLCSPRTVTNSDLCNR